MRYCVLLFVLLYSQHLMGQVHVDQNNKVGIGDVPSGSFELDVFGNSYLRGYTRMYAGANNIWLQLGTAIPPSAGSENVLIGKQVGRAGGMSTSLVSSNFMAGKFVGHRISGETKENVLIGAYNFYNSSGKKNVSIGYGSLATQGNPGEINNVVSIGNSALHTFTGQDGSIGIGTASLRQFSGGGVGFGQYSLFNGNGLNMTAIGDYALYESQNSSNSTAVGFEAGYDADAENSVYLGHQAGKNNNTDNRLFINNQESTSPLIYGEFDNEKIRINGELEVRDKSTTSDALAGWDGDKLSSLSVGPGLDLSNGQLSALPENQSLSFSNPNLSISGGGSPIDISGVNYWSKSGTSVFYNDDVIIGNSSTRPELRLFGHANILDPRSSTRINNSPYSGWFNVYVGKDAGGASSAAQNNVGIGYRAYNLGSGDNNVAIGKDALKNTTTGHNNVAIGIGAGSEHPTTASNCVYIGPNAGYTNTVSNRLYISSSGLHTVPLLYGEFDNKKLQIIRNLSIKNYSGDLGLFQLQYKNGSTNFSTNFVKNINGTVQVDWSGGGSNELIINGELKINDLSAGTPVKMLARDASNHIVEADLPSGGDNDWTESGNDIYNANSGNVGIGTTTPEQPFHIDGNTRIEGRIYDLANNYGQYGMYLTPGIEGANGKVFWTHPISYLYYLETLPTTFFTIMNGYNYRMNFDSYGGFGVIGNYNSGNMGFDCNMNGRYELSGYFDANTTSGNGVVLIKLRKGSTTIGTKRVLVTPDQLTYDFEFNENLSANDNDININIENTSGSTVTVQNQALYIKRIY